MKRTPPVGLLPPLAALLGAGMRPGFNDIAKQLFDPENWGEDGGLDLALYYCPVHPDGMALRSKTDECPQCLAEEVIKSCREVAP